MEPTPGPFAGVGPHRLPGSLAQRLSPAPLGASLVLTHLAIMQGEALEIKHPKQGTAQHNKNVLSGAGSAVAAGTTQPALTLLIPCQSWCLQMELKCFTGTT